MLWEIYETVVDFFGDLSSAKQTKGVLSIGTDENNWSLVFVKIYEDLSYDSNISQLYKYDNSEFFLYNVSYSFAGGFMKLHGYKHNDNNAERKFYLLKPLNKKEIIYVNEGRA